ncbi:MAG: immunoglobulin domain-containing protein [Opitutaceae bacterium]|nr:immunoglobulin domain-containing protein [Opitutaceae bacterium]
MRIYGGYPLQSWVSFWVSRLCRWRDWVPMIFLGVIVSRAKLFGVGFAARLIFMLLVLPQLAVRAHGQGAPVSVGDRVTMYVTSDGWPTPTLQWRKNGAPISGATSSTFVIASANTNDAGAYSVVATNSVGTATSPDEVLVVNAAPSNVSPTIQTQPASSQSVQTGASASFSVVATGTPSPTYQWRKNGSNLAGATSATLALTALATSDSGTYTVLVSNLAGSVVSSDAVLIVTELAPPGVAPSIQTQPASQTAQTGGGASFSVVASGTPAPSYQWHKNGVSLAGATAATLAMTAVTTNDNASYTVVVSNTAGSVTSAPATLTVTNAPQGGAPTIQTQPVPSQTAAIGGAANFAVAATGTPTPSYQWKKNGVDLAGATAATLVLAALTTNDNGTYTVLVSNFSGSVTSSPSVLTVTDPGVGNPPPPPPPPPPPANVAPQFTQHPIASQSVTAGATVVFSATASGLPDPELQWQKNGNAIAGATNSTLTLTGVAGSDGGSYVLVATNIAGTATSNAGSLTVVAPTAPPPPPPAPPPPPPPGGANSAPVINLQPVSLQTVVAGNSASLSVLASGYPTPGYQWRKNGVPISGATGSTISISSLTAADAAVYSVVVSNALGTAVSATATLVVHSRPVIVRQPAAQAVAAGSRAVLGVGVTAIPGPAYQWRRNGVAIAGATAAVYQIPALTAAEVGIYSVVATNPIGSVTSFDVPVQIAAPPVITQQPENQTVAAQNNVTFSVAAFGAPAPVFQWKRNGVLLPGATGDTLSLKGVTPADNGVYSAEASNSLGYAISAGARLTVSDVGSANPAAGGDGASSQPTTPAVVASRIVNLSVRSLAGGDSGALIVGFVLGGPAGKPILARGVGPTLGVFGVAGSLSDPTMGIYSGGNLTSSNDDWSSNANAAQIADTAGRLGAFSLPVQSADAALMPTLSAGAYTVQVAGKGTASGVTLVEVYDAAVASGGSLMNLSVRAQVGAGTEAPSLGFVISGTTPKRVMIRAVGPTLGAFGVADVLADPRLQVFQGNTLVGENDDWGGGAALATAFASVGAFPLADGGSKDAALVATLVPGAYTVLVSGVGNTAGATLLEVYDAP